MRNLIYNSFTRQPNWGTALEEARDSRKHDVVAILEAAEAAAAAAVTP